jgi:RNA polymerase sigma-70 factor (ECF subfamily)
MSWAAICNIRQAVEAPTVNASRTSSDEDLARDARAGSVASFEELARRVQGPLVAFLERRFPSRRDAEDVAQDALLRAWRALPSYREQSRWRTWVFTIAYRLAVTRGRGERAMVPFPTGDEPGGASDGPAEALERRERGERVWATARAVLTEEQASALWLYYVEELPAGEVARVLGRSWVSVKTMLHRARKKLEPHLAAEMDNSGGSPKLSASRQRPDAQEVCCETK